MLCVQRPPLAIVARARFVHFPLAAHPGRLRGCAQLCSSRYRLQARRRNATVRRGGPDRDGGGEADSRERYGHSILGSEYLQDHVHPTLAVHSQIAELVIDTMMDSGVLRPDADWSRDERREIFERRLAAMDRSGYRLKWSSKVSLGLRVEGERRWGFGRTLTEF